MHLCQESCRHALKAVYYVSEKTSDSKGVKNAQRVGASHNLPALTHKLLSTDKGYLNSCV